MSARYSVSKELADQGAKFVNFIHPTVNMEMVNIGLGNYIQESVVVQAGVFIGNNSSIHIGSMIGHESKIGNSSFIAHGCNLSGFTNVEDGVFVGAGVSTVPRVTIGKWSIIGTGAVVTKDIPPYSVAVGNPARVIKTLDIIHNSGNIL
jgi:acetyltransferase-like isoleucine patch superfamily enzyme